MTQASTTPTAPSRPAAVYRLYAADGTLLYIGSAYNPEERCKGHRDKPWWPEVASRTEQWCPGRRAAYVEEMKAIASEGSKYNQMGAPGYTTPDTPAVRERKRLASLRQELLTEAERAGRQAERSALQSGAPREAAESAREMTVIDFLEETGLFAGSVKWRRSQIAYRAARRQ